MSSNSPSGLVLTAVCLLASAAGAQEIRSQDGGVEVKVVFRNGTQLPVDVMWADFDGAVALYETLDAGAEYEQATTSKHAWVFLSNGQRVGSYIVTAQPQQLHIIGTRQPVAVQAPAAVQAPDRMVPGVAAPGAGVAVVPGNPAIRVGPGGIAVGAGANAPQAGAGLAVGNVQVMPPAQPGAIDAGVQVIPGIGPIGPARKLYEGFQFTEGPAADRRGNLFFSDIPAARIYRLDAAGNLSIFREPSGSANGLMVNAAGELVACEMEGAIVALSADGRTRRVLTDKHNGVRYNAPNDLVIDKQGGIYFTDPHFRAPEPLPQGVTGVYYRDPAGKVTRIIDNVRAPNGVLLSPDEKTLYVLPSLQAEMGAYPVTAPGKLGTGRIFCTLAQPAGKTGTGGDGGTVDRAGNVYITSAVGIQVFSADGRPLGVIVLPEQPANCTFGGPENHTLYVTARTSLYALPMETSGHRFAPPAVFGDVPR